MVTVSMNANVGSGAVWVQVWLRVVCVNMSIGEYLCVCVRMVCTCARVWSVGEVVVVGVRESSSTKLRVPVNVRTTPTRGRDERD